jgi:hypothetical protein
MKYICTIILIIISATSASAQNTKRCLAQLEKKDYQKARDLFARMVNDEPENPAANLGLAIIYSNEETGMLDIIKAWEYAQISRKNLSKLDEESKAEYKIYFTNQRRSAKSVETRMEEIIQGVEAKLIKYIREENNLQLVYDVMNKFPDFRFYDNLIHIRNQLEYRNYEKQNTSAAYKEFMQKFPDAAQVIKAKRHLSSIAFKEAQQKNTVEAYQQFMDEYPESDEYNTAQKSRNAVAFQKAKSTNTVESLESFIFTYPNALEIAEANTILEKLLYERAKRTRTIEAYNTFIKKYPQGKYFIDIFNLKSEILGNQFTKEQGITIRGNIWTRGFDNNDKIESTGGITCTSENGYIIAGMTEQVDTSIWNDIWIIKTDGDGLMKWNTIAGNPYNDSIYDIATNSTNEIVALGYTWKGTDSASVKPWIFKLGNDGKKEWNRSLGKINSNTLLINSLDEIVIGGYAPDDSLRQKYHIVVLNSKGKKMWTRTYTGYGVINDMKIMPDDNIVVCGCHWGLIMDNKGYIRQDFLTDTIDSLQVVTCDNNNNTWYAGTRNDNDLVIYKISKDGNKVFDKIVSYGTDRVIAAGLNESGPVIAIEKSGRDALLYLNEAGQEITTKTLPEGVKISYMMNDRAGNLLYGFSDENMIIVKSK